MRDLFSGINYASSSGIHAAPLPMNCKENAGYRFFALQRRPSVLVQKYFKLHFPLDHPPPSPFLHLDSLHVNLKVQWSNDILEERHPY